MYFLIQFGTIWSGFLSFKMKSLNSFREYLHVFGLLNKKRGSSIVNISKLGKQTNLDYCDPKMLSMNISKKKMLSMKKYKFNC